MFWNRKSKNNQTPQSQSVCLEDSEALITNQDNQKEKEQKETIQKQGERKELAQKNDVCNMVNHDGFTAQTTVIVFLFIFFVFLIALSTFEKQLLHNLLSHFSQINVSVSGSPQHLELNPKCKNDLQIFRVYYKQDDKEMKNLSDFKTHNDECAYPILGFADLEKFVEKWNSKYTAKMINLNQLEKDSQRSQLLVFLKLYFEGGSYIDLSTPVWKISNRSLKYALTGLEPIFAFRGERTLRGVYVPDAKKFMKVRIPYSPIISEMIQKLSKGEDFLERCRQKQCIIVG